MEGSTIDGFSRIEEVSGEGRTGRGRRKYDETTVFKSKNLEAERKRRQKLNDRLIALRALVPIITNAITLLLTVLILNIMNKATIIDDAVNYIKGLQKQVKCLSDQLQEIIEEPSEEGEKPGSVEDTAQEIVKCNMEPNVKVNRVEGNKLWIKIICEKRRGGFTKFMEAMSGLRFEVTDTNVTTFNGVFLITFCVEGTHVEMVAVEQMKKFLIEMIRGF